MLLEKPVSAGVVVWGLLEVEGSEVGVRLVVVTPKAGVLTLEGAVAALVMAVLELGVVETGVLEVRGFVYDLSKKPSFVFGFSSGVSKTVLKTSPCKTTQ